MEEEVVRAEAEKKAAADVDVVEPPKKRRGRPVKYDQNLVCPACLGVGGYLHTRSGSCLHAEGSV